MFESPIACNEALDQHYKAICWAGKSGGIEALKQATDLNIASERKLAKHYNALISWQGSGTSTSDCWNPEGYPERLATVMGNPAPDSVERGLNTEELGSKLTAWEGIRLEIVFYPLDPRESGNTTGIRQHASIQCLIQT
ncbi:hypothetical protein R3P38DRAFT_2792254 [Favolaschia claudopus]|uniref:Uncharacterized protein n=1 Tax=Favolaschia claudopus TaxID=2862362 RepID=A0AAW0AE25_9AGAR